MSEPSANKPDTKSAAGPDPLDSSDTVKGLRTGDRLFQHYQLRRMLGKGGMGVVWLAWDEQLDEEVALKFLPEIFSSDRMAIDDLKREAKRSRLLTHPNIVRIHSFEQDERCAGISMEYVDGDTLSNLRLEREDRSFRVEELIPIVRQICLALSHAHEKAKIVHRDLKPANLMLTQAGQLKVADFGLASKLSESLSMISVPRMAGTLAYMSPQQLFGEAPSVADDIYAMGATIYDLLTSKPPFFGGDVALQIREKNPVPMHERRAALGLEPVDIPYEWEDLVADCLAKKPEDRPASIAEIAARLGLIPGKPTAPPRQKPLPEAEKPTLTTPLQPAKIEPQPIGAVVPPQGKIPPRPTREPARGNGGVLVLVMIVVLLGAGAGWWFGYEKPRTERERVANALNVARNALKDERLEEAKSKFQYVLTLDKGNVAAKQGIKDADQAEADKLASKIAEYLKVAQEAFDAGRDVEAKNAYETVQALDKYNNEKAKKGLEALAKRKADRLGKDATEGMKAAKGALETGRPEEAVKTYEAVLTLDKGNKDAELGLANAKIAAAEAKAEAKRKEDQKKADEIAETARQDAVSLVASGRALLKEGKLAEAGAEIQKAFAAVRDFPDAKTLLSEIVAAQSNAVALAIAISLPKSSTKVAETKKSGAGKSTSKGPGTGAKTGNKDSNKRQTQRITKPKSDDIFKTDMRRPTTIDSSSTTDPKAD